LIKPLSHGTQSLSLTKHNHRHHRLNCNEPTLLGNSIMMLLIHASLGDSMILIPRQSVPGFEMNSCISEVS
jgi:hypothetical protein